MVYMKAKFHCVASSASALSLQLEAGIWATQQINCSGNCIFCAAFVCENEQRRAMLDDL